MATEGFTQRLWLSLTTVLHPARGSTSEPQSEAEHEVYLAGRWDQTTSHAPVLHIGSLADCEAYLRANPRTTCLRSEPRIRPTGRLTTAPRLELQ